jgi:hypothetical protein
VWFPQGISSEPDAYSWTVPHVMSTDELRGVADAFVSVADRLKHCGFGGVELHGAHGYLIAQILSPWVEPADRSLWRRVGKSPALCGGAVRGDPGTCGKDFLLGLKLRATRASMVASMPARPRASRRRLRARGRSTISPTASGNFSNSLENHVPDMHFRRAPFLDIAKSVRPAAGGTPVMAIGRIAEPAEAEAAILEGAGDFVGLTRALIADADWPNKAREGRRARDKTIELRYFAWGEVHLGKPLAEIHNPQLGAKGESNWRPAVARRKRRVTVLGAGPAGLQAARVAAERGHEVTLFSASHALGVSSSGKPNCRAVANMATFSPGWSRSSARHRQRSNVAGSDARRCAGPQARGGDPGDGIGLRPLKSIEGGVGARDWHGYRGTDRAAGAAVLFDMDHSAATYAVADALANRYEKLVLLTPRTDIARQVKLTVVASASIAGSIKPRPKSSWRPNRSRSRTAP